MQEKLSWYEWKQFFQIFLQDFMEERVSCNRPTTKSEGFHALCKGRVSTCANLVVRPVRSFRCRRENDFDFCESGYATENQSNLIGSAFAGRKKVEVNPTSKISRAIADDRGIFVTETNYACPENWSRDRATKFAEVETSLK